MRECLIAVEFYTIKQILAINDAVLGFSNFVQVKLSAVVNSIFDVDVGSDNISELYEKLIKDDLFFLIGFWTIPQNFIKLCNSFFLQACRAQNSEILFQIFNGHLVLWLLALQLFWNLDNLSVDLFLIFNFSSFF